MQVKWRQLIYLFVCAVLNQKLLRLTATHPHPTSNSVSTHHLEWSFKMIKISVTLLLDTFQWIPLLLR